MLILLFSQSEEVLSSNILSPGTMSFLKFNLYELEIDLYHHDLYSLIWLQIHPKSSFFQYMDVQFKNFMPAIETQGGQLKMN